MKQQQVETHIKDVNDRLAAIEQQRSIDEKIEKTNDYVRELSVKFSRLEGASGVVAIIFVVVSGLGLWKIYQYQEFVAAREEVYELLVSQIREQTSDAINKLSVTGRTQEDKDRINDLVQLQRRLLDLDVNSNSFIAIRELILALEHFIVDGNKNDADKILKSLETRYRRDDFVLSRVLTLRASIEISRDRNKFSQEVKNNLLTAIRIDSTVGLAYNNLGILSSNAARQKLIVQNLTDAIDLMKEADIYYSTAANLNPSALGAFKYINNKTWSNLLLFKEYLDHSKGSPSDKQDLDELLSYFRNDNVEEFFKNSLDQIEGYQKLSPELINVSYAMETIAQLLCVQAQYVHSQGNTIDAYELLLKAVEQFESAIDKGLYLHVDTFGKAIEQFDDDPLHTLIKGDDKYKEPIHRKIKVWYEKQGRN